MWLYTYSYCFSICIYILFIYIHTGHGTNMENSPEKNKHVFLMKKVGSYVRHVLEPCRKSIAKRVC